MRKKFLLVWLFFLGIFELSAQIQTVPFMPVVSNGQTEVWYYIQCTIRRPSPSTAQWLTGAAAEDTIRVKDYTGGDEQRWKLVPNGSGFALVNKAFGTYMNSDLPFTTPTYTELRMSANMPTTALQMIPSLLKTNGVCIANASATVNSGNFSAGITFLPYTAGSGQHYNPINYSSNKSSNAAFVFMEAIEKGTLSLAINNSVNVLNKSGVGSDPGQFSADNYSSLSDAVEVAKTILNDPASTATDFTNATAELNSFVEMFQTTVNVPAVSNDFNEIWYYLRASALHPTAPYVSSTGVGGIAKVMALSMGDEQLWKLVANPNGDGLLIKNKATDEYLNTDIAEGAGSAAYLSTTPVAPIVGLKYILSKETDNDLNASRFFFENSTGATCTFRLHTDNNSSNLMNWTGDQNDDCGFALVSANNAAQKEFSAMISTAQSKYDASASNLGDEFNQYSATARAAFLSVISDMKTKDVSSMSLDEIKTAIATLSTATASFVLNSDVNLLLSTDTQTKYFTINAVYTSANGGKYIKDAGLENNLLMQQATATAKTDSILWCIKKAPGDTTYYIISKLGNKMKWNPAATGSSTPDGRYYSVAPDSVGTAFNLVQSNTTPSVIILERADGPGNYLNTWADSYSHIGEYYIRSDANSLLNFTYIQSVSTALQSVKSGITVKSVNGKIVVTGTESPVKAYTVSGIQVDATKTLKPGIYIVVANGTSFKVII